MAFFGGYKVNQSKQRGLARERLAADEKAQKDLLKVRRKRKKAIPFFQIFFKNSICLFQARDDEIAALKAQIARANPEPVVVNNTAPPVAKVEGDWLDEWFGAAEDISADRAKKPAAGAKKH